MEWQRVRSFARLDPKLRRELNNLSMAQSRDNKIAFKLQEARIDGLMQEYYMNIGARNLSRLLRVDPVTEQHW